MFVKVSCANKHCISLIKNTVKICNIVYILKQTFLNVYIINAIYSCDDKAEFSSSLLQSTLQCHMIILICWFASQEIFLIIIINVENSYDV